ncbi:hypothetical protein [Halopseudomonas oceani]|uniref:hypothetical protein n=1 Tax=Halopseudomonas oceani TaxID=1708783 RepID=UPI002AA6A332|nr:hypothetical protein [Halopseudomonas oceani]
MINHEDEWRQLKRNRLMTQVIGVPGAILVGLGMYGVSLGEGGGFHPILNDLHNCYAMLVVGGLACVWEAVALFKIKKTGRAPTQYLAIWQDGSQACL